jgi:opacity protein-like surface antigen
MKTLTKFLSLALIASGTLFAGGAFVPAPATTVPDAEPVEPAVAEIPTSVESQGFQPYFGGSLGSSSSTVHTSMSKCGGCEIDKVNQVTTKAPDKKETWGGSGDAATATALAGVEVNDFLAVEARLTKSISDYEIKNHKPISLTNAAIYLKPQYKFEAASIYGLLGYGVSKIDFMDKTTTVNGFQYGAGASYDWSDELSVFADYTKLVSSNQKISDYTKMDSVGSVNAGVIFRP